MRLLPLVLVALASFPRAAAADDSLEPATDSRVLVAETWSLNSESVSVCTNGEIFAREAWSLSVTRDGVTHSIPVNRVWLADRIDSNLIGKGNHEARMNGYLRELEAGAAAAPARPALVIELASTAASGRFFVAGVWIADREVFWKTSSEHGSRLLGLDADQVRALGSAEALEGRLRERSDADWKAGLTPRETKDGDGKAGDE